jgi:hypothetical protein
MLINYNKLPDYLPVDEIHKYFCDLMDEVGDSENVDFDSTVEGLWHLANRQWHTYTILEKGIKTRIDDLLIRIFLNYNWRYKSVITLREILSIIGNLGLVKSYKLIKESRNQEMDGLYRQEIDNFINGIDRLKNGHIEDPYKP